MALAGQPPLLPGPLLHRPWKRGWPEVRRGGVPRLWEPECQGELTRRGRPGNSQPGTAAVRQGIIRWSAALS